MHFESCWYEMRKLIKLILLAPTTNTASER